MSSNDLPANGLPAEAQLWVREVEGFIRGSEDASRRAARNAAAAMRSAGAAVTAAATATTAQAAIEGAKTRVPAIIDAATVTVAASAYFDAQGQPHGLLDITVPPIDTDTDGNPLAIATYQAWVRAVHISADAAPPAFILLGSAPDGHIQVTGLRAGFDYQVTVCAVSDAGTAGASSDILAATIPAALVAMTAPVAPVLASGAGILVATWSGELVPPTVTTPDPTAGDMPDGGDPSSTGPLLPPDLPTDPSAGDMPAGGDPDSAGPLLPPGANDPVPTEVDPPTQFRYVYAEVSAAGAGTWKRMGASLVRGGGSIQISDLTVGNDYDVRLVAVDSLGVLSDPSATATITVVGVTFADLAPDVVTAMDGNGNTLTSATTAPNADGKKEGDLWFQRDVGGKIIAQWQWIGGSWQPQTLSHEVISSIDLGTATVGTLDGGLITARTIGADQLVAGSITANELSPTIGNDLDISANNTVNIIAGQLSGLSDDVNANGDTLDAMQTFYSFGPGGAVISNPGSPFQLKLSADQIQILQNGAPVSYWNSGQMYVNSLVGTEVILGNHKLEKSGTGTVVKAL